MSDGKQAGDDRLQVEQHRYPRCDLAGDHVARRQLVGEAVALLVEQESLLAAQRLREEDDSPRVTGGGTRQELEVSDAGTERDTRPPSSPTAAAGFVVRSRAPPHPPVESSVARAATARMAVTTPDAALAVVPDRERRAPAATRCAGARARVRRASARRGLPSRLRPRGRRACGCPAFEAEALVELDAELDQVADARRRFVREHGYGARPAEPTTGPGVSSACSSGESSRPIAAAIPPWASRLVEGGARPREHQHLAFRGRAQRCEEAGDAASHDDERKSVSRLYVQVRSW